MNQRNPSLPEGVASTDLRSFLMLRQMKSAAERSGHQFAARMLTASGNQYVIATDEPDNLAAWIMGQESQ